MGHLAGLAIFMVLVTLGMIIGLVVWLYIDDTKRKNAPPVRYLVNSYSVQSDRYNTFIAIIGREVSEEEDHLRVIRAPLDTVIIRDAEDGVTVLDVVGYKGTLHIPPE